MLAPTLCRAAAARARTLGFIGLGAMGSPMALNLFDHALAHWPAPPERLFVYDAHRPAAEAFVRASLASRPSGAVQPRIAPSPAQ